MQYLNPMNYSPSLSLPLPLSLSPFLPPSLFLCVLKTFWYITSKLGISRGTTKVMKQLEINGHSEELKLTVFCNKVCLLWKYNLCDTIWEIFLFMEKLCFSLGIFRCLYFKSILQIWDSWCHEYQHLRQSTILNESFEL